MSNHQFAGEDSRIQSLSLAGVGVREARQECNFPHVISFLHVSLFRREMHEVTSVKTRAFLGRFSPFSLAVDVHDNCSFR